MRIFPDTRLVACMAMLALLSCGLLLGTWWLYVLTISGVTLLSFCALDYLWLRRHAKAVLAACEVPVHRQRDETIDASIRLWNEAGRPLAVEVRCELPAEGDPPIWTRRVALPAGGIVTLPCTVHAPVRGSYRFGDFHLRVCGPAGLLRRQYALPNERFCKVLPDVKRVRDYIVARRAHVSAMPHLRRTAFRGIGSDFESLRDYETGDDIRRIDWRATARHGRFIVRNYEVESFRNILVLIDRGRLMSAAAGTGTKLDAAIDAALMVCAVALDGGDRAGVMLFDKEVSAYLPPRGSIARLTEIVDTLYAAQPVLEESDFVRAFAFLQTRLTKRSLIVALTDVVDVEVSRSLLEGVLALNRRHLVAFAAIQTPILRTTVTTPLNEPEDPYRKAAAYQLVHERREVIRRLRKGGVHVLDVTPEQLTAPLIDKYLELRESNRL